MNQNRLFPLLLLPFVLVGCTTGKQEGQAVATTSAAKTLRIALTVEPSTLDPAKTPDIVTSEMLMQTFEGLVRYNERNEIAPVLAEKWDLSPDGKTYTFHLRHGVKFHNGREFVASDVKYSWERALDPATASTVAADYLNGILGVSEITKGNRKDLPGVEVVDPYTLKVTIDSPRAFFLGMLTYPTGFVVCKEAVEKTGGKVDQNSYIGTGPFLLDSYQPGVRVTLKANPNYWSGRPKMDAIEMPVILNPDTLYNNFETGAIDIWPMTVPLSRYSMDKLAGKFAQEYRAIPTAQLDYLVMHPGVQPAFADKRVRLAFAMAIDRAQIFKVAYKDVGHVANGMVPSEIPNAGQEPSPIPYDPAKAKQLLADAGYPDGKGFPALTLVTLQQTPVWQEACQIIRANLKDNLHIEVNLQEREAGQFWDDQAKQTIAFCLTGWVADYPDAQDFLSKLFASNSSINRVAYHNPEFDVLCAKADVLSDMSARAKLYQQANQILMNDVGALPMVFTPRIALIHKNVQGWKINLCNMLPYAETSKQ